MELLAARYQTWRGALAVAADANNAALLEAAVEQTQCFEQRTAFNFTKSIRDSPEMHHARTRLQVLVKEEADAIQRSWLSLMFDTTQDLHQALQQVLAKAMEKAQAAGLPERMQEIDKRAARFGLNSSTVDAAKFDHPMRNASSRLSSFMDDVTKDIAASAVRTSSELVHSRLKILEQPAFEDGYGDSVGVSYVNATTELELALRMGRETRMIDRTDQDTVNAVREASGLWYRTQETLLRTTIQRARAALESLPDPSRPRKFDKALPLLDKNVVAKRPEELEVSFWQRAVHWVHELGNFLDKAIPAAKEDRPSDYSSIMEVPEYVQVGTSLTKS